jgi:hypothetical protein
VGQKTGSEKFRDVFTFEGFCRKGNSVETSDIGIDKCLKEQLVILQSTFPKYFPEVGSDKYN